MSLRILFFAILIAGALIAAGNLTILAAHLRARRAGVGAPPPFQGPHNLHLVDSDLWRGSAPSEDAFAAMAEAGVTDVVDLRAEGGPEPPPAVGLTHHHIPIRDGQPPRPEQAAAFLEILERAGGPVYVHCAAGVGRTGSMVATYDVKNRGADPATALRAMLAVGPPSLEQIAYVRNLGTSRGAGRLATAVSRVLDAPRRSWSRIRQAIRRRRES